MQKQDTPNRLTELMTERHVRLAKVAAHCDVDQSTVWRWSTGRSPIPDDQKAALAVYFGVTRSYLMGWDEEPVA